MITLLDAMLNESENVQILFRKDHSTENEFTVSKSHFSVVEYRSLIQKNAMVIPRYSALPFFRELEADVKNCDAKLINSYAEFQYIANFDYYHDIKPYTFKTYFDSSALPEQAYVVKGATNSRKHQWDTMCFAKNRIAAIDIASELKQDSLIGPQDIIFREYVPLKTFEILLNGLPVANEYRFFFFGDVELCHGYYWVNAENIDREISQDGIDLAHMVAGIISKQNNFFSIDVAEKESGGWIVVEVNSGEMSGLSCCNPEILYNRLKDQIARL